MTPPHGDSETPPAAVPVQAFPYVAVVVHASGIHPSTSRMITLDAVTFDDEGTVGESMFVVVDPGADPGPRHMHGLSTEEVAAGQRFGKVLKQLDTFIDGRVLICHNAPMTWGFIVSEARRAMNAAARANRSRSRGRNRSRRRQRVGHVPRPEAIVDTLATTRRQCVAIEDTRIAAVAERYGLPAPHPAATVERARRDESANARELTELLVALHRAQYARDPERIARRAPEDLRADRFGLQRSNVRVDAVNAPRPLENPGPYDPATGLQPGMEVVVAPEVAVDPNDLIEACMRAELVYSEKLTRQTSLVVCNKKENLTGKAMHAHRKEIPLLSDAAFLAAVEKMRAP